MSGLIKAELVKGRHTFGRKSLFFFPLLISMMAIVLMGGRLNQAGTYNWWYMLILPTLVILLCNNLIGSEKKNQFFNILVLPMKKTSIWMAKIITGSLYVLFANFIVFTLTIISGLLFGAQYPIWRGIAAMIVLTVTLLWQIPVGLFLNIRFDFAVSTVIMVAANMVFSSQDIAGGKLWMIPFAISARLMAPILKLNPNGIPLMTGDSLLDTKVIIPGILITITLYALISIATAHWFGKREV